MTWKKACIEAISEMKLLLSRKREDRQILLPRTEHAFEDITTEEAIKRAIHDGNPIVEVLTLVWKQARRDVKAFPNHLKKWNMHHQIMIQSLFCYNSNFPCNCNHGGQPKLVSSPSGVFRFVCMHLRHPTHLGHDLQIWNVHCPVSETYRQADQQLPVSCHVRTCSPFLCNVGGIHLSRGWKGSHPNWHSQ